MALSNLTRGDVVMAECVYERKPVSGGWTVHFELVSVAVIARPTYT